MAVPSDRYSLCTSLFATAAFLLGWVAAVSCRFLSFSSTSGFSEPVAMRFGLWTRDSWTLVSSAGGSTVVYETCHRYPSDVAMDSDWRAARAFSTLALVYGGAYLVSNLLFACLSSPNKLRFEGLAFLLASVFQGLALLVLQSALCQDNDLVTTLSEEVGVGDLAMDATCSRDTGANCAIAATVFWCVAGLTSRMASLVEKNEGENNPTTEPLISGANL